MKLSSILIGLLALVCVGEGVALYRMDSRLARLEATATSPAESRRTGSTALSERGLPPATEGVVRAVEDRVGVLERGQKDVLARIPSLEAANGATRGPVLSPSAKVALDQHIAAVVDRKLAERGKGGEEKKSLIEENDDKPSVRELSEAVGMTEEQEDATVQVLNEAKKQSFDLLIVSRADGGSMAQDLVDALKGTDDHQKALGGWLQKLMTERVPGRNETYLNEIMKIQRATWDRLGGELDETQIKKLRRMGLDILEVKTGYEPFEELFGED